jgi:hypothetical protein
LDTCDHPIKLGSILFTLVEPAEGRAKEYNRWYERDHLYSGVMIGPYSLAAGRFVATRELKALRYPEGSPISPEGKGSYLAVYFILDGHHDDWWKWGRKQVKVLIDKDRMFEHRTHVHTQLYQFRSAVHRDPDGVPTELALDHRFPGLVVVWGKTKGSRDDALAALSGDVVPSVLEGSPAAMCLTFAPFPMPPGQPSDVPASTDDELRFLHMYFCDADPREAWKGRFDHLGERYAEGAEVLYVSPFIGTIPGTDTYADEL